MTNPFDMNNWLLNEFNLPPHKMKMAEKMATIVFGSLIESFKQNGGHNPITLTFADGENNKYDITVHKHNEKPFDNEVSNKLEEENQELRQQLSQMGKYYKQELHHSNITNHELQKEIHRLKEEKETLEEIAILLVNSLLVLQMLDERIEYLEEEKQFIKKQKQNLYSQILQRYEE